MNKTKIVWPWKPLYTWNPVIGCQHNCSINGKNYCYARRMNQRFKYIEQWDEPQFFPERLEEPGKLKKPSTIFVGSMCDLFGDWVPSQWILCTVAAAQENPQHKFMFLTKNPLKYGRYDFPENCWLGTTVTCREDCLRVRNLQVNGGDNSKFVSVEPLLGSFEGVEFDGIDQVIVGAQTGPGADPPRTPWIYSIKHPRIFYKQNIKDYM